MNKTRLMLKLPVFVLVLMLMAFPVQATDVVEITLTPSQVELTAGDRVELTLEAKHPAGYQVIFPKLGQNWGSFEVQGQSQATTVASDDGTETTYQIITVTLFEPGTFETPALPLTISNGSGGVIEQMTPPVSLTVNSVLSEGDTTLKDIRPQVGLKSPSILPWVLVGLLALTVVAGAGWWIYRRYRRSRPLAAIDSRPPYQVAYDELDRIDGLGLPEKGRFKEHYTLVTDCLRTYIERQFRVHAFDRTTTELYHSLRQSTMSPKDAHRFIDLLRESDLVKFAKLSPYLVDAQQLTGQARALVDLTKPVPATEEAEELSGTFGAGRSQKPMEAIQ